MAKPGVQISVDLKKLRALKAALKRLGPRSNKAMARALNSEHENIMTEAKRRTPVDTGALRSSGHVMPPIVTASKVISKGAFGGASVPYALKQHEDLTLNHPVGQAKFYESSLLEQVPRLNGNLTRRLKRELGDVVR